MVHYVKNIMQILQVSLILLFNNMMYAISPQLSINGDRLLTRVKFIDFKATTGKFIVDNMTLIVENRTQFLYAEITANEDVHLYSANITIYRCNNEGHNCENFQQLRFDNAKQVAYMGNQMWTPIIAKIKPKLKLPIVPKGIYVIDKATPDYELVARWYNGFHKYTWMLDGYGMDEYGVVIGHLRLTIMVMEYRERQKKKNNTNLTQKRNE